MKQGDWVKQARCSLPEYRDLGWVTEGKPGAQPRARLRQESKARRKLAEVCNACPVIAECREYADKTFVSIGFWGGKNYNYRITVEA